MFFYLEFNSSRVLKCANNKCDFMGLDLETWIYPYSKKDYYQNIEREVINPDRLFINKRIEFINRYIKKGKFAELGCGLGETTIAVSKAGFEAWGVEESRNAISYLKKKYPKIHWICNRLEAFLNSNKRFDIIALFHVLEHIPNPQKLIPHLSKSLKKYGYMVIEVPDVKGGLAYLRGKKWEYWLTHHVNYFSLNSLKRLLEPHGFRLVEKQNLYHFGYPQGVLWKDVVKGFFAKIGINNIIRTIWQIN